MSNQPNILLITSDQHRADTLGCAGHPCARTPHLDKLAQMGIRFDRAYADCPVCIPQRTTLVTGIKSHVYGMPNYAEHYRINRDRSKFLGSLLTAAGYQTEIIGKAQHWHTDRTFRGGFEHILNERNYHEDVQFHTRNYRSDQSGIGANELFPDQHHLPNELQFTQWVVDRCIQFLRHRDKTQPFFLWCSFIDPHPPNTIHEPYYSMYDNEEVPEPCLPEWIDSEDCPIDLYKHRHIWNSVKMNAAALRKARGVYYGKVTHMDHQLGRLLGKLQSEGLSDDTWIIYSSDHGEMLGDLGDMGKSTFQEHSTRLPLIVCPPAPMGLEPGRITRSLAGWDDLLPTFCEIAGVGAPDDITGTSLMPIIQNEQRKVRDLFHGQIGHSHMLHDGKYKYLYCADDGKELLFDTDNDGEDRYDLHKQYPDLLRTYRQLLIDHLTEERHEHVQEGRLINYEEARPPLNQLRAVNVYGWH